MSARIDDLEPVTRALCQAFLSDVAAAGHEIKVTHTLRTLDEQANLYAKGRQTGGAIVTYAPPGASPHNWGAAFDVCFKGATLDECFPPASDPRWQELGRIGTKLGLVWGGYFKRLRDYPHFERADWRTLRDDGSIA